MSRVSLMVCAAIFGAFFGAFYWCDEVFPFERVALALSGPDCRPSHQAMIETLERLEGIVKVEADVVPDHLLIDHDGRHLAGEELAGVVNAVAAAPDRCRAAVMRSCITADYGTRALHSVPER